MNVEWRLTRLAEVIHPALDPHTVDASRSYANIGIYSFGRGVFAKPPIEGANTSATTLYRVRGGQFIYSRLFAFEGAYATVPPELDGAYVSNEFPAFDFDTRRIDPGFLKWSFKRPSVWREIAARSTGMGDRRQRIHPEHVVEHELYLPPLDEQRRIVTRIEALAEKVDEARSLRKDALAEVEALRSSAAAGVFDQLLKGRTLPLANCVQLERGKFSHRPRNDPRFFGGNYPWIQIGEIEASGKLITDWHETLNDEGLSISKLFPRGTVLISIAATIGAVGILDFDCCVPDSIVGVTPPESISSEFVYHYLLFLRTHLESIAPQSAQKNINLQILGELPFPVLSSEQQGAVVAELDALQAKLDAVTAFQAEAAAELNALMPAILDKAFKGEL